MLMVGPCWQPGPLDRQWWLVRVAVALPSLCGVRSPSGAHLLECARADTRAVCKTILRVDAETPNLLVVLAVQALQHPESESLGNEAAERRVLLLYFPLLARLPRIWHSRQPVWRLHGAERRSRARVPLSARHWTLSPVQ